MPIKHDPRTGKFMGGAGGFGARKGMKRPLDKSTVKTLFQGATKLVHDPAIPKKLSSKSSKSVLAALKQGGSPQKVGFQQDVLPSQVRGVWRTHMGASWPSKSGRRG